jgi:formylglycine-generating enzyme required for sulfatase activity
MDQTYAQGPADVFLSGGLSPYGVMGLGGNVWEWEESTFDVTVGNYNQDVLFRGIRGGSWQSSPTVSSSSSRSISHAWYLDNADRVGFRVAAIYYSTTAVPEPSGCALFALLVVVCLLLIT